MKYKYGLLSDAFRESLIEEYTKVYNDVKIAKKLVDEHYKKGRPYLFIKKDDEYYYALPAYSGMKDNEHITFKNDYYYQKIFFYLKQHENMRTFNGYPYVSLRSPLIISKAFINEINLEYIDEIHRLAGNGTKLEETRECYKVIIKNAKKIECMFNYVLKKHKDLFERKHDCVYIDSNTKKIGFESKVLKSNKFLSHYVYENKQEIFDEINKRAELISERNYAYLNNNTYKEKIYKKKTIESIVTDGKIKKEFLEDRIKRKTPYRNNNGHFQEIYGAIEQELLMSSYVNGNHLTDEYVMNTTNRKEIICEHLKDISKYIVTLDLNNNANNRRHNSYKFYYSNTKIPRLKETSQQISKREFVNKLIRKNENIILVDKGPSCIIGPTQKDKHFIEGYQVNCHIKKNEDVDVAIDLIITNYICQIKNNNNTYIYLFGNTFLYNNETVYLELLNLEIKRKITEKTGIQFNLTNTKMIENKGIDILSSLKRMGLASINAKNVVDKMIEDLNETPVGPNRDERKYKF